MDDDSIWDPNAEEMKDTVLLLQVDLPGLCLKPVKVS